MSMGPLRVVAAVAALFSLASCSAPAPQKTASGARTPDFYWSAAVETWSAGNYAKTTDHLERLIEKDNPLAAKAVPWYLVVTSGMVRGYSELADRYARGANFNRTNARALNQKAAQYRTAAGKIALRFAQESERFQQVPLGKVHLAFPMPKGSAAEPPLLTRIGAGMELAPADRDAAEAVALQRGVLMTVCLAAGAPNDTAKTREILSRPTPDTTREAFAAALAQLLKTESGLFARDKLDDPAKLAAFQKRADLVLAEGTRVGNARIGLLVNAAPAQ